jgi:Ca-activated chloride channel homolog
MSQEADDQAPTHHSPNLLCNACLLLFLLVTPFALSQDRPVFTAETDLQSIAVEVTDHQGRAIRGLTADDFTLFEDGRPQKIAFFGAEEQPVSLAVLVDSSASMQTVHKLDGVREMLPSLLKGNLPEDEIYFAQFTDRVFPFQTLTGEQRLRPQFQQVDSRSGTAFYDALATSLCTLRGARNLRQAVVVITDGADQHSRLTLDQVIQSARASRPQIFTIGYFEEREADLFRRADNVITLVNSHDIDNPLKAFQRISNETGAESFFPASQRDLEKALARILAILRAQYTLAYHTARPNAFRRIEVKTRRAGAIVSSRRAVGSDAGEPGLAHFSATGCEVSPAEHPYPWEPHITKTAGGLLTYRDDFSDPRSGWPIRPGIGPTPHGYQVAITAKIPRSEMLPVGAPDAPAGEIVANGPLFTDFRASVKIAVQGDESTYFLGKTQITAPREAALVFRLNERGCYLLLVQWHSKISNTKQGEVQFRLAKKFWGTRDYKPITPWDVLTITNSDQRKSTHFVGPEIPASVECVGNHITVRIDGVEAASITDDTFGDGQAGVAIWGVGRALFRDLVVEGLK